MKKQNKLQQCIKHIKTMFYTFIGGQFEQEQKRNEGIDCYPCLYDETIKEYKQFNLVDYDCNENKYGFSFYNFTETDFKYIKKLELKYPLANYAMVDLKYNIIQLFQDYKEIVIYRRIFDCTEIKILSLFHNYLTTGYYEWDLTN